MVWRFEKKPFMARVKDTFFLLKNTFTLFGKEKDLKTPLIKMILYSVLMIAIGFASVLTFLIGKYVLLGVLGLLLTFILLLYRFFYDIKQKACLSWLTYNTISGRDISLEDSYQHIEKEGAKLKKVGFVDLLIKFAGSQRGRGEGIKGFLINLFLTGLLEVWDLLSHYMLPAVVIEGKKLKETIPKIKTLRSNVPATLTGVFGIEFVGNVIDYLLFPLYILFLIVSVGIGYLLAPLMEFSVITIFGFSFSWIPVYIMMALIFTIGAGIGRAVKAVKSIYFTIFYTAITEPDAIVPSIRDEVTRYLKMEK